MPRQRQSNLELLRIIAALMIVALHVGGASIGLPQPDRHWTLGEWSRIFFESVCIIGVNLFVLISGYFSINVSIRRVGKYLWTSAFYSIGIAALAFLAQPDLLTPKNIRMTVLFLSQGDLWFVRDYFFLMLLSPMVNMGLKSLSKRSLNLCIAALLVINCYFGWLQQGYINPNGYNLMQMLLMYAIGYWLHGIRFSAIQSMGLYALSLCMIMLSATTLPTLKAFAYNNPAVIGASVGMFALFCSLRFHSKFINSAAKTAFAVYLIHKHPFVWGGGIQPAMRALAESHSGLAFLADCFVAIFAITLACMAIDSARSWIEAAFLSLWKTGQKKIETSS